MKKIFSTLLILQLGFCLYAQSPDAFKFQSIIRDFSGNLITDKIVHIEISILQGSISGTVVFNEKHDPTTNKFGLVNLEIGNGTIISGALSTINWANGPYFISIAVNGNVIGTSQLLSVPYAKYADKAANGFSGNYSDLTNKPVLFDGSWTGISGKPNFSPVTFSGSYNDLQNKPTFDGSYALITGKPSFSTVSKTGSYNDLLNTPVYTWNLLTSKPTTAAGYGITNVMTTSHAAYPIALSDISNWNTAFAWGDHSLAGYAIATNYYTRVNLQTSGQSLIRWENLTNTPTNTAGYGITDAVSTSIPAYSITSDLITKWNSAFNWGNHSTAGYGKPGDFYSKTNLQTSGQASVLWNNLTNKPASVNNFGIPDIAITSPVNNQLLHFTTPSNTWINWTPNFIGTESQSLTLSANQLSLSSGNSVTFTNWDTDKTDDVISSGDQSIAGNKSFTGTLTASSQITANNGLDAGNTLLSKVANPLDPQDLATKSYVGALWDRLQKLEKIYNTTQAGGPISDYDGNTYNIVQVGTQTWMSENLKTLHYQNGDQIATTSPINLNVAWDTLNTSNPPRYQWPPNGDESNVAVYGRLYTYYVVTDPRKVCPTGWHVPSKTEWDVLIDYLGGIYSVGGKLKEAGLTHWIAPNSGATNSSGMTLLPNGNRHPEGLFAEFTEWGCYQTTTETPGYPNLNYHFHARNDGGWAEYSDGKNYHFTKVMAYAVRCLKD